MMIQYDFFRGDETTNQIFMGKPWQTVRHANGLGSVATAPLPVRSGEELPIL